MMNLKCKNNEENIVSIIDNISNETNIDVEVIKEIAKPYLSNGIVIDSIYDDILDNITNIFIQSISMNKDMPDKMIEILVVLKDITYRIKKSKKAKAFINHMEKMNFDCFKNYIYKILNGEVQASFLYRIENEIEEYTQNNTTELLSNKCLLKLLVDTTDTLNNFKYNHII